MHSHTVITCLHTCENQRHQSQRQATHNRRKNRHNERTIIGFLGRAHDQRNTSGGWLSGYGILHAWVRVAQGGFVTATPMHGWVGCVDFGVHGDSDGCLLKIDNWLYIFK